MHLRMAMLFYFLTILFSISIDAYRLDTLSREDDLDVSNELTDPYLIQRLQLLLAAAATAKQGYKNFPDDTQPSHLLSQRFAIPRHPGLIRLK